MNVGTRDGRIVSTRPADEAPVNKGHLCVKALRLRIHLRNRPDHKPMIRDGARWRIVSWNEAMAFYGLNWNRLLKQHGPQSVGVLGSSRATNEENYLAQKFARVVLGTNNVDCCARVCHAERSGDEA
jgi:formate dehydrogenase major subunit